MEDIILRTENLSVNFSVKKKIFRKPDILSAVSNVNISVRRGETYGLVGESGCGKTTLANALLGFVPVSSGFAEINGVRIDNSTERAALKQVRKGVQMVFQDPYSSLNPRFLVWQIITEPMLLSGISDEKERRERASELLEQTGLNASDGDRYVYEFSGGQRQRIAIARAVSSSPELIVCDEPTSALDVSVHSQICNLLLDLQDRLGFTYFFITHNLALVKQMTDHMSVMYMGQIMEQGRTEEIFRKPSHPYTKALISSVPQIHSDNRFQRIRLEGEVESPLNAGNSCRFYSRCPEACELCRREFIKTADTESVHFTACLMNNDK